MSLGPPDGPLGAQRPSSNVRPLQFVQRVLAEHGTHLKASVKWRALEI